MSTAKTDKSSEFCLGGDGTVKRLGFGAMRLDAKGCDPPHKEIQGWRPMGKSSGES
ncbi:MAG: hypothetical protein KF861_12295 [Planctomycetaceae bacterium]|nr:hypothetical protein [Planctomycetaceae bacterium]